MIDLLLLVVIGGSTLLGLLRGFVGTLVSLAAWLLAGWASFRFGEHAAFWLSDDGIPSSSELLGGYASVFVAVVVAITLAGMLVKSLVKSVGLSGLDRLLGLALGAARGALVACMGLLLMAFSSLPQEPAWPQSRAVAVLTPGAQWMARWLPDWAVQELDFGNGRPSGDNALVDQAGAMFEAITGALPVPVDEQGPEPGAEPPPPSHPPDPGR